MKSPQTKITVNKLDAARRQLQTAIALWFEDGDPVAIHALVSAAHEIIHTLFKRKGLHGLMFDTLLIKDEHRSDWAKLIKRASGFFKHAREDPDGTLEFNPAVNEGLLFACANALQRMGEPPSFEEVALGYWLRIQHPSWTTKTMRRNGIPVDVFKKFRGMNKRHYFQAMALLWRQGRIPVHSDPRSVPLHP